MRCETCSYWEETPNTANGQCRFNPPQMCYFDAHDGDPDPILSWLFPETEADDWCGQWHKVGTMLPNGKTVPLMRSRTAAKPEPPGYVPPSPTELV